MSSGKRRQQSGFTYLVALLLVAVTGASTAMVAEAWSHAREREKEAELIWIGNKIKDAIGVYYQRSPGTVKRYPEKLEDLLEDRRFLSPQRYLRQIYRNPHTESANWELVRAPEGGIQGVRARRNSSIKVPHAFIYQPTASR
jgi:hypothetical protein